MVRFYAPHFTLPFSSLIAMIPGLVIIRVSIRVRGLHLVFAQVWSENSGESLDVECCMDFLWTFVNISGFWQEKYAVHTRTSLPIEIHHPFHWTKPNHICWIGNQPPSLHRLSGYVSIFVGAIYFPPFLLDESLPQKIGLSILKSLKINGLFFFGRSQPKTIVLTCVYQRPIIGGSSKYSTIHPLWQSGAEKSPPLGGSSHLVIPSRSQVQKHQAAVMRGMIQVWIPYISAWFFS